MTLSCLETDLSLYFHCLHLVLVLALLSWSHEELCERDRHRRTLTLSHSELDVEVNRCTNDRLGHHQNILQTDNDHKIWKYLTSNNDRQTWHIS